MFVIDLIKALRWIGPRAAWESLRFAWIRDRLEVRMRRRPRGASRPPGDLQRVDPADDGARFIFERAQLEARFLSPWALRVQWTPGPPPPPYSLARAQGRLPRISVEQKQDGWELSVPEFSVHVSERGRLRFRSPDGELLREDRPPVRHGETWTQATLAPPEEHLYGLGERAAGLDLRPGRYRLWNTDAGGSYSTGEDPLYMSVPILVGLQSAGGYLVYYENTHDGEVDLGAETQVTFRGGQHRYVFIAGAPPRALERLTRLIGRPAMPPRWALGYHQSRWGYENAADVRRVLEGFERHSLPLAALHLDIDYMRGYRVFTVDRTAFPDLRALAERCRRRLGARLVAIVDPGIKVDPDYKLYQQGKARGLFCCLPDGQELRGSVWPGAVHYPDFSDPQARSWWGDQYSELLEAGISGIWHDMNEPTSFAAWGDTTFPLPTRHAFDGQPGDHRAGHNLYGHLMNRAGYEALRRHRPGERPFLLSRSGWAGSARYAWNWTGDTASTWEALAQTLPTVLGLGLSGVPFSGPDIGGFSGAPDRELYLRWFQLGAMLPFFRTHSSKLSPPREPWQFDAETLRIAREFLQLRQALLPYLYTLAAQAHHTGWPLARPLFWEHPQDPALWGVDDAFLLGDRLLVAPILHPGSTARSVTLPEGDWFDYWDGTVYRGPGEVRVPGPLERIPLLVRAGSVLPLAGDPNLELHVFPPRGRFANQPLYTDPGDGFGAARWDFFSVHPKKDGFELTWRAEGSFAWPHREIDLVLRGEPPTRLRLDDQQVPLDGGRASVPRFHQAEVMQRLAPGTPPP